MNASKIDLINDTPPTCPLPCFNTVALGSFFLYNGKLYIKTSSFYGIELGSDESTTIYGHAITPLVDVTITYKVA